MLRFFVSTVFFLLGNWLAHADAGLWQTSSNLAKVRLISSTDSVPESGTLQLGLEFEIDPGWVTYWKVQGPVGIPLQADWNESTNIAKATIKYPLPTRYTYALPGLVDETMQSFVYQSHVVFPISVEVIDNSQPVYATAKLQFTVCGDLCLFTEATVRLDLFPGRGATAKEAEIIQQFQALVPTSVQDPSPSIALVGYNFDTKNELLRFEIESIEPMSSPDVFVGTSRAGVTFDEPTVFLSEDSTQAAVNIPISISDVSQYDPRTADLYVTISDGKHSVDLGYIRAGNETDLMPRLQDHEFTVPSTNTGVFSWLRKIFSRTE